MTAAIPEDCYLVEGGNPLSGRLRPSGSKNAALPILAATLLTETPVELTNVPRIRDVEAMLLLLQSMGATVDANWSPEGNTVTICTADASPDRLDMSLCGSIRASLLLAGPLLARFGSLRLPPPGGDVIGRRRLDSHFLALTELGAVTEPTSDGMFRFGTGGLVGSSFLLDEPSVTGTENALMAAALARGTTTIYNAACEPNVQDLARFLRSMGAGIEGSGTNRLTIHGTGGRLLDGSSGHSIAPDHIEIGSFIGLAACCGGEVTLEGVPDAILQPIMRGRGLSTFGISVHRQKAGEDEDLVIPAAQRLAVRTDMGGAVPEIYDHPWPGFSPDLTSTAVIVATQSQGTCLIHEKMFEARLFFVDKLVSMGARIVLCDPHRVVISGPTRLRGTEVTSPDIRPGMALLTAALCAEGTSLIRNVHQIERGYERLVERLTALGASIEAGPGLPIG